MEENMTLKGVRKYTVEGMMEGKMEGKMYGKIEVKIARKIKGKVVIGGRQCLPNCTVSQD